MLQCGSCDYKWFFKNVIKDYKPLKIEPNIIESTEEIQIAKQELTAPIKKGKQLNYFKLLLVFIISIVALIVLIDTFKHQISSAFPNTDIILFNLYESLTDINLFIRDLIK